MPAKVGIRYSVISDFNLGAAAYWIIRFRG